MLLNISLVGFEGPVHGEGKGGKKSGKKGKEKEGNQGKGERKSSPKYISGHNATALIIW